MTDYVPPTLNPLRPMGLGELLDRSVNFWRAHWRPLFLLMLGFQLVEFTLVTVAQGAGHYLFPLARDPSALQRTPLEAFPQLMGSMAFLLTSVLAALLVGQIAGVAATHFSFLRVVGKANPAPGDAFRYAASKLGTTVGAFFISMAWSVVVMVLLLLPATGLGAGAAVLAAQDQRAAALVLGVLAAIALLVATVVLVLWFIIRFILLSQIIAVEPLGAVAAFRRADALSSGRVEAGLAGLVKLRLTVLVTIMGAVLLIVSTLASLPLLIAGAAFGAGFTPGNTLNDVVPVFVLVPLELLQTVLGALVAPLYVVFQTFFYADMRARREGLDLELALGAAAA